MRKNIQLLGAVAVAGLVAATGSAFTASSGVVTSVAGYGTNTVTGATTTAIAHTLSSTGSTITSTLITFSASQTGRTVKAGFGTTALQDCVVDTATTATGTTATCTYVTAYDTATATAFQVAVV